MNLPVAFIAMVSCLAGFIGGGPPSADRPQSVGEKRVTVHLKSAEVRAAIKQLFNEVGAEYDIAPEIQGTVNVDLQNVAFDVALKALLDEMDATFRVEPGRYVLVKNDRVGPDLTSFSWNWRATDFWPRAYSGSYEVRNKRLFMTPHRTIGGTYDLLQEAAIMAGFDYWSVMSYGDDGFALVLPMETIRKDGLPLAGEDRFRLSMYHPDEVAEAVQKAGPASNLRNRVLVLVVSTEPIRPDGLKAPRQRMWSEYNQTLSVADRRRVWDKDPKLTVLVYSFRAGPTTPVLVKPGESKISAKAHVIGAGLWTKKQLEW